MRSTPFDGLCRWRVLPAPRYRTDGQALEIGQLARTAYPPSDPLEAAIPDNLLEPLQREYVDAQSKHRTECLGSDIPD